MILVDCNLGTQEGNDCKFLINANYKIFVLSNIKPRLINNAWV